MGKYLLLGALLACAAHAQEGGGLKFSRSAWSGLSATEQAAIQAGRLVEVRESDSYGVVVDNQGVDESTPGTTAGAVLGGSIAQAAYIDRSFKPGRTYSATNQLAIGILGAIVGASFDKPPVHQYHFRYAIKLDGGEIRFVDSVQGAAFRFPAGLCVSLPELGQLPQSVCQQTSADLRRIYFAPEAQPAASSPLSPAVQVQPADADVEREDRVACKLGNLPAVPSSTRKCNSIGGTVL
jgi:outer membrane lipoprotein SlyB